MRYLAYILACVLIAATPAAAQQLTCAQLTAIIHSAPGFQPFRGKGQGNPDGTGRCGIGGVNAMTLDDLKKLLTGRTLLRLDTIIGPRLVPLLYALGLAAILLWAVSHLFFTFGSNFGNGLWGLLEIVIFGLLAWTVLRIACDALTVYFKTHEDSADTFARARLPSSLLDEVREAIREGRDAQVARMAAMLSPDDPDSRMIRLAIEGWIAMFDALILDWLDNRTIPREQLVDLLGGSLAGIVVTALKADGRLEQIAQIRHLAPDAFPRR